MLILGILICVSGETFQSLHYQFYIGASTISRIVYDVCDVLYKNLQPEFMIVPETAEEWVEVSKGFANRWNFPNCIGMIS